MHETGPAHRVEAVLCLRRDAPQALQERVVEAERRGMVVDEPREPVGAAEATQAQVGVDEPPGPEGGHAGDLRGQQAQPGPERGETSAVQGGQHQVAAFPGQVRRDQQAGPVRGRGPAAYLQHVRHRDEPPHQPEHRRVHLRCRVVAESGTVDPDHRPLSPGLGEVGLSGPAAGQRRQLGEVHAPTLPQTLGPSGQ